MNGIGVFCMNFAGSFVGLLATDPTIRTTSPKPIHYFLVENNAHYLTDSYLVYIRQYET